MEQEQGPWIDLDKYTDLANFVTVGSQLYPDSEAAAAEGLSGSEDQVRCVSPSIVAIAYRLLCISTATLAKAIL